MKTRTAQLAKQRALRHPCSGCTYYYGHSDYSRCCNYLLVTGRRRPCPPGAGCTVKSKKRKRRNPMGCYEE